jgi:hypothetical protein
MSRFDPDILNLVVGVLTPAGANRNSLMTGLDVLFSERWQADTWGDLMVFSSSDVAAALVPGTQGIPSELTAPVIVKKLGYIIDYAQIGTLTPASTMNDIVSLVTASKQRPYPTAASSPSRRAVLVFDL